MFFRSTKITKFVFIHVNCSFKWIKHDLIFSTKMRILRQNSWFRRILWLLVFKNFRSTKITIFMFLHVKCSFQSIKQDFIFNTKMRILRWHLWIRRILWVLVSWKIFGVRKNHEICVFTCKMIMQGHKTRFYIEYKNTHP